MYAVVIGVDTYAGAPSTFRTTGAVERTEAVAEVLRDNYSFEEIITLYGPDATRDDIDRLFFRRFPAELTADDALFIYISTPTVTDRRFENPRSFFLPYDTTREGRNRLSIAQFRDHHLDLIPARHVAVVLDVILENDTPFQKANYIQRYFWTETSYLAQALRRSARQIFITSTTPINKAGSRTQDEVRQLAHEALIEELKHDGDPRFISTIFEETARKFAVKAHELGVWVSPFSGREDDEGDMLMAQDLPARIAGTNRAIQKLAKEKEELLAEVDRGRFIESAATLSAIRTRLEEIKVETVNLLSQRRSLQELLLMRRTEIERAEIRRLRATDPLPAPDTMSYYYR